MAYQETTACRSWLCCLNCSSSRFGCRLQLCCLHAQCGDPAFSYSSGRQKLNCNLCVLGIHTHGIPTTQAVMSPSIEPTFNAPPLQTMTQHHQHQPVAVGYPAQQRPAADLQKQQGSAKAAAGQPELQAKAGSEGPVDKMGDRISTGNAASAGQPAGTYPAPPTNSTFQ